MERGFSLYQGLSTPPVFWPALLTIRATVHGRAGDSDRALALIAEAWSSLRGDYPEAADIAIAHGDLLLAAPGPDVASAVTLFERAAAVSHACGARMVELQALTRLAGVRRGSPQGDEVLARLRELYETFTEGSATHHLRAAHALLAGSR